MIFKCSGVELDTIRFVITSEGKPISVTPKVFDLLVFLMRHPSQLITREQLFDELWPDRVVMDNVLSNEIKLARAVLGDDGEQQKFIKTMRGRGYQFVGEVQVIDDEHRHAEIIAAKTDAPVAEEDWKSDSGLAPVKGLFWRRMLVSLSVLCGILLTINWVKAPKENGSDPTNIKTEASNFKDAFSSKPNTIAILPFKNRSNIEQDAFFVDGFHDDLITQVSHIKNISAISRSSVMVYRGSSKSMRTIANELGSAIVIEGGVQRAGDQIRINVQVIDAAEDKHIWAETYTRALNAQNIFNIQSEIATAVATTLRDLLAENKHSYPNNTDKLPTENLAALEAFFRGRVSMALVTSEGFGDAAKHFQDAVNLDPDFAEAHAQLAIALLEEINYSTVYPKDNNEIAEAAVNRALGLNPELSEAYEALAMLERSRSRNNPVAVEQAYEQALKFNPENVNAIRGYAFFKGTWLGQHQEALTLLNAVKLVDPLNPETLTLLSQFHYNLGHFDEARAYAEEARYHAPEFAETYRLLGDLYAVKFYQHDEAIKAYRQFHFLEPDSSWNLLELGTSYDELGDTAQAVHFYKLYLKQNRTGILPQIARVRLHLALGQRELANGVFEEIKIEFSGKLPWVDIMLSGFDLHQGNPEFVIKRFETYYPNMVATGPEVAMEPGHFRKAMFYATALLLSDKTQKAAPWIEKVLEVLPSKGRDRWGGIQTEDVWLHMAMGNENRAIQSLHEWRAIGARLDLTKHRMVPASLFENPEFQAINNQILAELAEQRSNLARMEASEELAPNPEAHFTQIQNKGCPNVIPAKAYYPCDVEAAEQ